jgi:hypothetical protein
MKGLDMDVVQESKEVEVHYEELLIIAEKLEISYEEVLMRIREGVEV